ncbi:MAG: flagellar basal body L-ring protein FlgH [Alphaproteobacteria bacterium]|nr:flagellar basal body L-ring protein FlgH [Alphaproteobacteria bacterium]
MKSPIPTLLTVALAGFVLAGCNAFDRASRIGEKPELSPIENPVAAPGYRPVSLPMPPPQVAERMPNSLWRAGSRTFFKDLRATRVGDILTVTVTLDEKASLSNSSTRTRTTAENDTITSLFGFEHQFKHFLSDQTTNTPTINIAGATNNVGTGAITRAETVSLRLATLITQVLPNGNLVIDGHQEIRVNFELRELRLIGVIRPEDIAPDNTISYDQIAEARVSYGGRGQIDDVQQPRYGSQLLDILLPF